VRVSAMPHIALRGASAFGSLTANLPSVDRQPVHKTLAYRA
jgi:hypothetical protein